MSETGKASFSIPSILAIICAIASFYYGTIVGLLLALAAIVFGIIGIMISLSARKRGGVMSTASIFFGLIGIIAAIIKGVLQIFT